MSDYQRRALSDAGAHVNPASGHVLDAQGRRLWWTRDAYRIVEADDGTPGWAYWHVPVTPEDLSEDRPRE